MVQYQFQITDQLIEYMVQYQFQITDRLIEYARILIPDNRPVN